MDRLGREQLYEQVDTALTFGDQKYKNLNLILKAYGELQAPFFWPSSGLKDTCRQADLISWLAMPLLPKVPLVGMLFNITIVDTKVLLEQTASGMHKVP